MRLNRYVCGAALAVMLVPAAPAPAQEASKQQMDAETEAYLKMAEPGDEHAMLAKFVGSWETTIRIWMVPNTPATESKGTAEIVPILGGRHVREEFSAEMMGMPFSGFGLTGYDKATKKYVSTWADSMTTGIMKMEGDYDAATKKYNYTGSYVDPMRGPVTMKISMGWTDENNHVSEFYDQADGKWVKIMEIAYKRK